MQRTTLLCLFSALLFNSGSLFAQTNSGDGGVAPYKYTEVGLKGGVNFQQIIAYPFTKDYGIGYIGGLYYECRRGVFGLKAELTASSAHYQTEFPVSHDYMTSTNKIADSTT